LAMDASNLNELRRLAPNAELADKARLLRSYDPAAPKNAPVPDPYYGDDAGFDHVLELCRVACRNLLQEIRREQQL